MHASQLQVPSAVATGAIRVLPAAELHMTSHAHQNDGGNTVTVMPTDKALDENDVSNVRAQSAGPCTPSTRSPYAAMAHPKDLLAFERQVQRLQGAIAHLKTELRVLESQCQSMAEVARATISSVGHPAYETPLACLAELTRQESHVALWAAYGAADADIATSLGLSVYTIKSHMKAVLHKLGMHSRWELRHVVVTPLRSDLPIAMVQDPSRRDGIGTDNPP